MLPRLTVQQEQQRCRCERLLAWPLVHSAADTWGYDAPLCVRCFRPLGRCRCRRTRRPLEDCLAIDFATVAEPEGHDYECE
jgi:hypothetical protein